ncbi:uncharacterized protein LOC121377677 [Gigantopelta aegis]|uniref:uncharacterized protein LOC121377677 n=1 Tax=Gigantopelta aegis TaxID=1735272 RepID=UPI001B889443|nr:uncharacterized protein LOC121377677 [Gigantopelta aegis]
MDASSVYFIGVLFSGMFLCSAGISLSVKVSTETAKRNQKVTVTCTLQDSRGLVNTAIYVHTNNYRMAYFYQRTSSCNSNVYNRGTATENVGFCGSGTNSSESSSKEYTVITKTQYDTVYSYCKTTYRGNTYYSNFVPLSLLNKVECASLTISGSGAVLKVTEGKEYNYITCSTGGASPEPEVTLKLNDTSLSYLSARKSSTYSSHQNGLTLCSPRKYDGYSPRRNTNFVYTPSRRHDGQYVYCSAKNSEMGIDEEVSSNKIRVVVQYGPADITFIPDEVFYTVQEFESLTVTCFTECNPNCTYTWAYQGQTIVYENRLFLHEVTRLDAGYYNCTARNPGHGVTAKRSLKLRVQYGSLSTGAEIGIGLAVGVVVMSVVAVLIYCVVRRKTQRRNRTKSGSERHTYANTGMQNLSSRQSATDEVMYEDLSGK